MKNAINFLLILSLAVLPWGCSRDNSMDSTSANSDTTRESPPTAAEPARQDYSQPNQPRPADKQTLRPPSNTTPAPARPANPAPRPDESARLEPIRDRDRDEVAPAPAPRVATAAVPEGTTLTVIMQDLISTATAQEGDKFVASLAAPLSIDGRLVAERGDRLSGIVQNVQKPGNVKGRAELSLVLTQITTGNRTYKINTEPFVAIAADNKGRDAGIIAGGAGVGAAIGAIAGGKKGAAIGAILGGGGGTTAVLVTPGSDMKIEPETKVNFVVQNAFSLPVIRRETN